MSCSARPLPDTGQQGSRTRARRTRTANRGCCSHTRRGSRPPPFPPSARLANQLHDHVTLSRAVDSGGTAVGGGRGAAHAGFAWAVDDWAAERLVSAPRARLREARRETIHGLEREAERHMPPPRPRVTVTSPRSQTSSDGFAAWRSCSPSGGSARRNPPESGLLARSRAGPRHPAGTRKNSTQWEGVLVRITGRVPHHSRPPLLVRKIPHAEILVRAQFWRISRTMGLCREHVRHPRRSQ